MGKCMCSNGLQGSFPNGLNSDSLEAFQVRKEIWGDEEQDSMHPIPT